MEGGKKEEIGREIEHLKHEKEFVEETKSEVERGIHQIEETEHRLHEEEHRLDDEERRIDHEIKRLEAEEKEHKLLLVVSVNGKEVSIEVQPDETLDDLRGKLLEMTNNLGRPQADWEFKTIEGAILSGETRVRDLPIAPGYVLFLSLKAGSAGV